MTTQHEFILRYYKMHPGKNITNAEAEEWARSEYQRQYGKRFGDPGRMIRKLREEGHLEFVSKGVYRFPPQR